MTSHETLITEHVLETTKDFPTSKRAAYLHALAAMTSSNELAGHFEQLAQDLDNADRRQIELKLIVRNGGTAL